MVGLRGKCLLMETRPCVPSNSSTILPLRLWHCTCVLCGLFRYKNSWDGRFPVETMLIEELIPHIDATYSTIAGALCMYLPLWSSSSCSPLSSNRVLRGSYPIVLALGTASPSNSAHVRVQLMLCSLCAVPGAHGRCIEVSSMLAGRIPSISILHAQPCRRSVSTGLLNGWARIDPPSDEVSSSVL